MKIGIDLGGTKTEVVVLDGKKEVFRHRTPTPAQDYLSIISNIQQLITLACDEIESQQFTSIGLAMPGAITEFGLVKNSNTKVLNGKPFVADLESVLGLKVFAMNDANCFTLSESVDGAAESAKLVFGVILGTGVGGGIVIGKSVIQGVNTIAGEWGHNPLPSNTLRVSHDARPCYCGRINCIETFLSGSGLLKTIQELGDSREYKNAVEALDGGGEVLEKALDFYTEQLAASLSLVINILDPDCIVLGGGLSNIDSLCTLLLEKLPVYVFNDSIHTRVVQNKFGDSSGVRGAAWLNENG